MIRRIRHSLAERGIRRFLDLILRRIFDWRGLLVRRAIELTPHQRRSLLQQLRRTVTAAQLTVVLPLSGPTATQVIPQLQRQSFPLFRAVLLLDAGLTDAQLRRIRAQAARDARLLLLPRPAADALGIAAAYSRVTTPYVLLCDAAVRLADDAVALLSAEAVQPDPPLIIYGDDDSINRFGLPERPRMRPAFDRFHLYERDFIDLPLLAARPLLAQLPAQPAPDRAAAVLELLLLGVETAPSAVRSVPFRLARRPRPYRPPPRSPHTARLLTDHFARCGVAATLSAVADRPDLTRVEYDVPQLPPVTLIVPTRDRLDLLQPCVESVLQQTDYPDFELIIIDNGSRQPQTLAFFAALSHDPRVRVLRDDGPFDYAALNNQAAALARGSLLCLLNNDTEIIEPNWLRGLVSLALQPGVGTVGPLLLYPDLTIQSMGVTTGPVYPATTIGTGDPEYQRRHNLLWCTRGVIANTAACLVVRTDLFLADGGFDPRLKVDFNDVELGLRLHRQGYVNLWTPHVRVLHRHGATRGRRDTPQVLARRMAEADHLTAQYPELIGRDPFHRTVGRQSHRPRQKLFTRGRA